MMRDSTTTTMETSSGLNDNNSTNKKRWIQRRLPKFLTPTPPEILRYRQTIVDTFVHGNDDDICDYVNRNKPVCMDKHSFGDDLGTMYPLSMVVRRRKKPLQFKTVRAVHELNPEAIHEALHHACAAAQAASLDVMRFLVTNHPDGCEAQYKGWYPLHLALASNANYDVVEYILESYPLAIEKRACWKHGLPLHIAIEHGASLDVIELLLSKYPEAIKMADYITNSTKRIKGWIVLCGEIETFGDYCGGGLPLHLACRHNVPLPVLKHLIVRYPDALKTKNRIGWLPLHYACSCRTTSLEFIEIVHKCCPDALTEHNGDFMFPVDMAASHGRPNMDIIRYLISRHPTLCPPLVNLFYHYHDEAIAYFAGMNLVRFLRSVAYQASNGYTYVYPNEI